MCSTPVDLSIFLCLGNEILLIFVAFFLGSGFFRGSSDTLGFSENRVSPLRCILLQKLPNLNANINVFHNEIKYLRGLNKMNLIENSNSRL